MKKNFFTVLPLVITFAVIFAWQLYVEQPASTVAVDPSTNQTASQHQVDHNPANNNPQLLAAYNDKVAKLQIKGQGTIVKILKDDLEGSRHQRLLLRVNDNQTVLIAHNIDLAPRIPNPEVGGVVEFYGEYVWNNKGGVIHWTHKDPSSRHTDGWLRYYGKLYQ